MPVEKQIKYISGIYCQEISGSLTPYPDVFFPTLICIILFMLYIRKQTFYYSLKLKAIIKVLKIYDYPPHIFKALRSRNSDVYEQLAISWDK